MFDEPVIVDVDSSEEYASSSVGYCMRLTNRGCAPRGYWCSLRGGTLTWEQMARLQGFEPDWIDTDIAGVSESQIAGMVGNAMSVNVLARLIPRVLFAGGLATKSEMEEMLSHSGWE